MYLSDNVYIDFIPNGHLFGSASIYLTYIKDEYTNRHLLFTGDHFYGAKELQKRPFTKSFDTERTLKPNIIITEATYGGRYHIKNYDIEKELALYKFKYEMAIAENSIREEGTISADDLESELEV